MPTPESLDVVLASCRTLPEPDPDAAPLEGALAAAGLGSAVLAWDDPAADWSRGRITVLRSTWNYPLDRDGFLLWADGVAKRSALWNPPEVVRWNSHKGYLLELQRRGLPVAPTVLLPRGSETRLTAVLDEQRWSDVVVKPAVSAASFRTMRVGPGDGDAGEAHLRSLARERDVLVQRYLPSVEDYGERALIWIDGELTHAVRKSPRFEGDDESVSTEAVDISPAEADLARSVLEQVDQALLYARVDVAPGPGGDPLLMELELIEPSLFFARSDRALTRFVQGIAARLPAR